MELIFRYQHVDCSTSENHYGKNAALNMKIDNMSDMMAVVNEMMTFPLKTNASRPSMLPNFDITTRKPSIASTQFPSSSQTTDFVKPITLPSSPTPTTSNQFENRIPKPQEQTEAPPKQDTEFGTKTITQEGDIEFNSTTGTDSVKTVEKTMFKNEPIFISSLGELSIDPGNKFDINKAKIIKPEENTVFTPPTVSKEEQEKNELKQSLSQSFNNQNNNQQTAKNAGENKLFDGLQRALKENPNAASNEDDLLQFVRRILQQNPDLSADQLNAILSEESDAILQILTDTVEKNQNTANGKSDHSGENNLLLNIQNILDKHKNGQHLDKNHQGTADSPAIDIRIKATSGESDLLDTLRRILKQARVPIFSGEADLLQFIERLQRENPDFTAKELNAIISGEADSILKSLNAKKNNGSTVSSGESDLLEAIQQVLQKYRQNGAQTNLPTIRNSLQPPLETGLPVADQRVPVANQVTTQDKNRLSQPNKQILNQQNSAGDSPNAAFFNQNANNIGTQSNRNKPVSTGAFDVQGGRTPLTGVSSLPPAQQNIVSPNTLPLEQARVPGVNENQLPAIESGEADLLETIRMIALRIPNKQSPVFSEEAGLLQFIQRIKQENSDISINQLNAIISGEANSILQILNKNGQKNQNGLFEAIRSVIEKYRQNDDGLAPPLPVLMFSGEKDLLKTIDMIQQQSKIQIFSGEADLLQFIRRIERLHPNFTPSQLNAIISGESDSILKILNQKPRQNQITSGEADLLDAIEQVLQKYGNKSASAISSSGESDLQKTLQRIQQQLRVPIFSGEADLVQFIERIQQRNPDFTLKKLNEIISGEKDSILRILNEKAVRNGNAISSGEANLLDAIQLVLDKYRANQSSSVFPQSSSTSTVDLDEIFLVQSLRKVQEQSARPIFASDAEISEFSRRLHQRNPDLSLKKLSNIISSETNAIVQILNAKAQSADNDNFGLIDSEDDLLVAVQYYVEQYVKFENNTSTVAPQSAVLSGESDLVQTLQRIQQQSRVPIFSGEADLVQFIERIKQRHPEFTSEQLNAIISGEASSISQILDEKVRRKQSNGIPVESGEADLLEAIEIILQKYRGQNGSSGAPQVNSINAVNSVNVVPSRTNVLPPTLNVPNSVPITPFPTSNSPLATPNALPSISNVPNSASSPIEDSNLLQTIKYFGQQIRVPIFSGEADLVQFIEQIKRNNPEFTSNQLNAIISGEADSILQLLNQKIQRKQIKGIVVSSGEADLFETIQEILQKYKSRPPSVQTLQPSVASSNLGQSSPVVLGESDLLRALQKIQRESAVPIFSGNADLLQFIEQIKQTNPDIPENQLTAIISSESNSILEILKDKGQSVSSGEAELFNAIYQVLQKYRQSNQIATSQFGQERPDNTNFFKNTQSNTNPTVVSER